MFKLLLKRFIIMIVSLLIMESGSIASDSDHSIVVLLHGLLRSPGSMDHMEKALEQAGYTVLNLGYPSTEFPIEELATAYVLPEILDCIDSGYRQVHFVTHSLGGIIVRQLRASGAPLNFGRVVMLGPPNGGSEVVDKLGNWVPFEWLNGPAGLQLGTEGPSVPLALGSTDLELGVIAGEHSINPILSMMIPGEDDGKVSIEHAKLTGMRDFIIISATHPFLPRDPEAIRQALCFLKKGQFDHQNETTNSIGLTLIPIPPGSFIMGSITGNADSHEKPLHEVTIQRPFFLSQTEVTQAQWAAVMGDNPSHFLGNDRPVESVSWYDVMEFIRRLNEIEDYYQYRLPTEAEWEYACRTGTESDRSGDLDSEAWLNPNSGQATHPVGRKQANAWGLHDMPGNVYEWCEDLKGPYSDGPVADPHGPFCGSARVIRGGSWSVHTNRTNCCFRDYMDPDTRRNDIGFRIAAINPQH
ncbi:SUMF1/EgtB/PvdO family nonheme iron enzyme [bacterium]|nr:SUMF1/EgtB/PvdO family nonheme iron enzyme [candidate division CSSED10-310 bacterium]